MQCVLPRSHARSAINDALAITIASRGPRRLYSSQTHWQPSDTNFPTHKRKKWVDPPSHERKKFAEPKSGFRFVGAADPAPRRGLSEKPWRPRDLKPGEHDTPTERKEREQWMIQKAGLKDKLGDEAWNPRKRLSPDTIDGIRTMHASDPAKFSTPILAEHFKVSPDAVRRILKSKWQPNPEEQEDRRLRWEKRGEKIWSQLAEVGVKPPKPWRVRGVGRAEPGETPRWKGVAMRQDKEDQDLTTVRRDVIAVKPASATNARYGSGISSRIL